MKINFKKIKHYDGLKLTLIYMIEHIFLCSILIKCFKLYI